MDDKEIFNLVRESYASANADYIAEQIRISPIQRRNQTKGIFTSITGWPYGICVRGYDSQHQKHHSQHGWCELTQEVTT